MWWRPEFSEWFGFLQGCCRVLLLTVVFAMWLVVLPAMRVCFGNNDVVVKVLEENIVVFL